MRVIVTGGSGFIGSALCRHLVRERGASVLNIDALTYAAAPGTLADIEARPEYRFAKGDIRDAAAMMRLVADFKPTAICNVAAESHVDRSISGPKAFLETNITGVFAMLEAARSYWDGLSEPARSAFRFVQVSTDEVFGTAAAGTRFTEETPYDPSSPYSASKAAGDHLVRAWGRTYGLPVVLTNCSNNYGPYQFPEKFIPLALLSALHAGEIPVYGDGQNVRDWLFVDDHARGIADAMAKGVPGESYLFGGNAERRNIEVAHAICDALDAVHRPNEPRRNLIRHVTDRPGHDRRYAVDFSKAERELGWTPSVSFEDGLARTIAWYSENAWWWQPLQTRYDGRRIGLLKTS
ncbi:dTDP-glucose 4,6-dehydratase 2 [Alphaproteobacteria bacterium SO-S41]|nr:dTDP-glucose 4,6-dehydratase 2 [Alphaproteobacteria bacterium SO-S41]